MAQVVNQEIQEIDYLDKHWMIQLAKQSRSAEKLVIKNFRPTSTSISFVKAISADNHLFISSWDDDLVLERLDDPTPSALPQPVSLRGLNAA